jgi:hypothetical protein
MYSKRAGVRFLNLQSFMPCGLLISRSIYIDFNLGGIDWDTYSIKNKAQNTKQCKQLLDI